MALHAGARLGDYEVVSSLGAGGMGEVYRARDTGLGREVALKLLLDEVSADPERLARFKREARVLASLNHANIATLYGFESEGDTHFLVMELVPGETLADRIARGPIPVAEAIALFIEIAEGLEAAHEKGIVHRDLKPSNIKVSEEGSVKILDFGLAKALVEESGGADAALSHSPTLTLAATQRGQILGTAAYMAPEQAKGKSVDKRADVWAFGACLFEALAGKRMFQGDDASELLASVLLTEPAWERASRGDSPARQSAAAALPGEEPARPSARHRRRAHRAQPRAGRRGDPPEVVPLQAFCAASPASVDWIRRRQPPWPPSRPLRAGGPRNAQRTPRRRWSGDSRSRRAPI